MLGPGRRTKAKDGVLEGAHWMTLWVLLAALSATAGGERLLKAENQEVNCNYVFTSSTRKNGTISSPAYPRHYPSDTKCQFIFEGVGKERVQLRFTHMDLHYPGGDASNPLDCSGSDHVTVYVLIDGQWSELYKYCGKKLPPMLMSSNNKMKVTFTSFLVPASVSGFQASYAFVTNFGITSGTQDERGVCMFRYYSSNEQEGRFHSPNYPGLYPRNIECHYLFFGKGKEKVYITFERFVVDGVSPQCRESTESDYVSFSNFQETEDRKMHRLCSELRADSHRHVESDEAFFRVIFKSNHVYDAEGFLAHYQFKAHDDIDKIEMANKVEGTQESEQVPAFGGGTNSAQPIRSSLGLPTLLCILCLLTCLIPSSSA